MSLSIALGRQPYLPGHTQRPSDDTFAPLIAALSSDLAPDELAASHAFQEAQEAFRQRYYWEAHELLEAVWMCLPPASAEKLFLKGLIQLANAGLKGRMGQDNAVRRIKSLAKGALSEAFHRASKPMGMTWDDVVKLQNQAFAEMQYNAMSDGVGADAGGR